MLSILPKSVYCGMWINWIILIKSKGILRWWASRHGMWYLISKLSKGFYNQSDFIILVHRWCRLTSAVRAVCVLLKPIAASECVWFIVVWRFEDRGCGKGSPTWIHWGSCWELRLPTQPDHSRRSSSAGRRCGQFSHSGDVQGCHGPTECQWRLKLVKICESKRATKIEFCTLPLLKLKQLLLF